jgi:general stress protein 26
MDVATFDDLKDTFFARVNAMVWCNVGTVDSQGRPRSRIMHPVWEGPVGWVTSRRETVKARHIERCPYVSLAYIADVAKPVYVDCRAEWIEDLATKQRIWELCPTFPPPMGFDLAPIFGTVENPNYGLLKLTPWRIELPDLATRSTTVWRAIE